MKWVLGVQSRILLADIAGERLYLFAVGASRTAYRRRRVVKDYTCRSGRWAAEVCWKTCMVARRIARYAARA